MNFKFCRIITIDNSNNPEDLIDYQVPILFPVCWYKYYWYYFAYLDDNLSRHRPKRNFRFLDCNFNVIPHWQDQLNLLINNWVNIRFWVKVPFIPANGKTTIYVLYDEFSDQIGDEGNGKEVFEFFGNFTGDVIDSSVWQDWSVTGIHNAYCLCPLTLQAYNKSDGGSIPNLKKYRIVLRVDDYSDYDGEDYYPSSIVIQTDSLYLPSSYRHYIQSNLKLFGQSCSSTIDWINGFLIHSIEYDGSQAKYSLYGRKKLDRDYILRGSCSVSITNVPLYKLIINAGVSTCKIAIDYVFITKYTSPEPTVSVSPEYIFGEFGRLSGYYIPYFFYSNVGQDGFSFSGSLFFDNNSFVEISDSFSVQEKVDSSVISNSSIVDTEFFIPEFLRVKVPYNNTVSELNIYYNGANPLYLGGDNPVGTVITEVYKELENSNIDLLHIKNFDVNSGNVNILILKDLNDLTYIDEFRKFFIVYNDDIYFIDNTFVLHSWVFNDYIVYFDSSFGLFNFYQSDILGFTSSFSYSIPRQFSLVDYFNFYDRVLFKYKFLFSDSINYKAFCREDFFKLINDNLLIVDSLNNRFVLLKELDFIKFLDRLILLKKRSINPRKVSFERLDFQDFVRIL